MGHWTFLILLGIIQYYPNVTAELTEPCAKEPYNNCACQTKSGWINLAPLDEAKITGKPKFSDVSGSGYYDTIHYNPCTAFTESDSGSDCSNVAGCKVTDYGYQAYYYSLGTQETAVFGQDGADVTLTYSGGSNSNLQIVLVCSSTTEGSLTFDKERKKTLSMTLTTKYACAGIAPSPTGSSGGLSPGSIMLIIFFTLLFVYLVVGIVLNKFMRGAQGKEVVPNVTFWVALPGYVKDGTVYTINTGKRLVGGIGGGGGDKMYETIK